MSFDSTLDVRAAIAGDERAFCRLIERYQNAVASVALGIVRNVSASQDVAQATFVAAWQRLRTLRQAESFGPWLMQLTRREALQALRAQKRRGARDSAWHEAQPSVAGDASEALAEREMYQNLYTALDEIPADCREILLLYYREGRSSDQVAALLSIGNAAVRKRLERAREVLRDRFEAFEAAAKTSAPPAGFALLVLAAMQTSAAAAASGAGFVKAIPWAVAAAVIATAVILWPTPPSPPPHARAPAAIVARSAAPTRPAIAASMERSAWSSGDDAVFSQPPLSERASASVRGRVLTPKGDGVSGATVLFTLEAGTKRFVTGARGEYAGHVPHGTYRVSAIAPGKSAARPILFVDGDKDAVDLVLGDPARIDGLVRDHDGKPLRAHVVISPHDRDGTWARVESGEDGTFTADGFPPGSYDVSAERDDRVEAPNEAGVTVRAGGSYFAELQFRAVAATKVRVIDDTGAGVEGLSVEIGQGATEISALSGADGSVALARQLPRGKNRVRVYEPGGNDRAHIVWSDVVQNEGKAIDIVVPRFGELQIEAKLDEGRAMPFLHCNRVESIGGYVPAHSRVIRFDAAHTAIVRLPAGVWHLAPSESAERQAWPRSLPVTIRAGVTKQIQFTTRSTTEHTVRVLEANGQPARGAIVADDRRHWVADDAGVIRGVEAPKYPYTARASVGGRSATFTIPDERSTDLTVTLAAAAIIRGLAEGVSASESISVRVSGPDDHWFIDRAPLRFSGPEFELDDVPPGAVTITVQTTGGASGDAKITATPGEIANVRVSLGIGGEIKGSLAITNGPPPSPLPLVTLDGHAPMHVASGEIFSFRHLSPGKHTLTVEVLGDRKAERTIELAAGDTANLDPIELDATTFYKPRVFLSE
jgi:RNA polymerase sigma factor (sigma-70 family)